MGFELALFVVFGAIAIAGALGVVLARKPVYSGLCLLITFVMLGALYIVLNAQFVGIVQIIVYGGAVMVLFLFALMLVGGTTRPAGARSVAFYVGVALSVILLAEIVYVVAGNAISGAKGTATEAAIAATGNVEMMGASLFTDFLLPFELASVLLLVGIVGAVYLTRRESE